MGLTSFLTSAILDGMGDMNETISYTPKATGVEKLIKAVVFRTNPDHESVITKRVTSYNIDTVSIFISNDSVTGIPVVTKKEDIVKIKRKLSDVASTIYHVGGIIEQDASSWKLALA